MPPPFGDNIVPEDDDPLAAVVVVAFQPDPRKKPSIIMVTLLLSLERASGTEALEPNPRKIIQG